MEFLERINAIFMLIEDYVKVILHIILPRFIKRDIKINSILVFAKLRSVYKIAKENNNPLKCQTIQVYIKIVDVPTVALSYFINQDYRDTKFSIRFGYSTIHIFGN